MVESGLGIRASRGEIGWTTRPASGAASEGTSGSNKSAANGGNICKGCKRLRDAAHRERNRQRYRDVHREWRAANPDKVQANRRDADRRLRDAILAYGPSCACCGEAWEPTSLTLDHINGGGAAPKVNPRKGLRPTPPRGISQPDTGSFAGIAAGLTGSWATVRIDRLADRTFVWPDGSPTTAGGSTVAANVLEHGTGALNIDGCRINPGAAVPSGSGNRESFRVMEGRSDRQEFDSNPHHLRSLARQRRPRRVAGQALDAQSGPSPSPASASHAALTVARVGHDRHRAVYYF